MSPPYNVAAFNEFRSLKFGPGRWHPSCTIFQQRSLAENDYPLRRLWLCEGVPRLSRFS